MRVINQWFVLAGTLLAAGAGCATQDGSSEAPLIDQDQAGEPPGKAMGVLDLDGAKALDRDRAAAKARAFDVPGSCYTVSVEGSQFLHLDMNQEVATPVGELPPISGHMLTSLGHFGGSLITCAGSPEGRNQIAVYDLDGKSGKTVALPCDAVTGDGDHIWVMDPLFTPPPDRAIREYTSFAALVANQPSRTLPAPSAFSLGTGQGRLIAAWHSTNEVTLVSLADGSHTTSPLQGYDNWIFGSNESFGHRYMVGGWSDDARGIHVFDPSTGAGQGRMFDDSWLAGLTCGTP